MTCYNFIQIVAGGEGGETFANMNRLAMDRKVWKNGVNTLLRHKNFAKKNILFAAYENKWEILKEQGKEMIDL